MSQPEKVCKHLSCQGVCLLQYIAMKGRLSSTAAPTVVLSSYLSDFELAAVTGQLHCTTAATVFVKVSL